MVKNVAGVSGRIRVTSRRIAYCLAVAMFAIALLLLGGCGKSSSGSSDAAGSAAAESFGSAANDAGVAGAAGAVGAAGAATATDTSGIDMAKVKAAIEKIDAGTDMQLSCTFVDLETGQRISVDGAEPQNAASMIKLLILAEFLAQVDEGMHSLDEEYTIRQDDLEGVTGTGSLQRTAKAGSKVTLGQAAKLMISESDNVAANILIDVLGLGKIDARAQKMGLSGTHLNRKMFDIEAQMRGVENYTTSDDVATMLELVYRGEFVGNEASQFALETLQDQVDVSCLIAGLPNGVRSANKTGDVDTARNDGAIVFANHPYVLVALCSPGDSGAFDTASAEKLMGKLSSAVYSTIENV